MVKAKVAAAFLISISMLAGCFVFGGGSDDDSDGSVADGGVADAPPGPPADAWVSGPCNDTVRLGVPPGAAHMPEGTPITYPDNPPLGGPHWPKWARWDQSYASPPLPREYYVHNMEHGGVVLTYRCDTPCPAVVAGLEQLMAELPADPKCAAPARTRTLITEDPLLLGQVQVAASAWGASYAAECFDAESLRRFVLLRRFRGPEETCAQGSAPWPPP